MKLRPLGRLLFQGGVRVAVASLTVLCIVGGLYITVVHYRPEKKTVAEATLKSGCMPSHCRPKVSAAR
ncbi:hypothetical protein IVB12_06285 [Bradyrhizobium sp. 179]|uniref:hypothetical protein n=1 Tax=Bradyrhizobium sp. 179 TaxID=2782648 RepID=UPI001FF95BFE|nr:hypothetical protein [Bradyrhizobium sp. 179]MCK1541598.1 hypothetical protein [Bradyrhizobium sp. 179]